MRNHHDQITFDTPVFKCAEDKQIFSQRLTELEPQCRIEWQENNIRLILPSPCPDNLLRELQQIFALWGCTPDYKK